MNQTTEYKLTAARVEEILVDCLFKEEEPTEPRVEARAVMHTFGFHPERLESYREEVGDMLRQLPDGFHEDGGGGWSFLNACMDAEGNQWGEHTNIDKLIALGAGLKLAQFLMPRESWNMFPGGMPYFVVAKEGNKFE